MFSDPASYLWLIPALSLFSSALIATLGYPLLREKSHWPCILCAGAACVVSLLVLIAVTGGYLGNAWYFTWFAAGSFDVGLTLRADGLTAIMLVMVTFIGTLIAIYSAGYMHHDTGRPRFFAEFSLFLFFMTGLVLANNFIVLYACWEGVGLCSYLLIGYWYTRPAAAAAARKAFLVTRLGDVGLFIGIMLLWFHFGQPLHPDLSTGDQAATTERIASVVHSLEYDTIFTNIRLAHERGDLALDPSLLTVICLLILTGAAGKSAQFPLHVWLPDAMEGPTPVSALIHAATMVTAGVYLIARCTPLFGLAPTAQGVVATVGAITAILAALIALTQNDLKRVLAYSTLSQLGYMFLSLGCALAPDDHGSGTTGHALTAFAVIAAIFHLFTHAFFKALLFLGAGSVMHAMGDVIDMRRFGGLRRVLPTTHWTFLCGSAALAGVPLLSGFWSKDEILAVAYAAGRHSNYYFLLFAVGLLTAGLTAFYTFRAYFMTFWGEERIPPEAYTHGHDSGHGHDDGHGHDAAHHPAPKDHGATAAHAAGAVHESPPVMTVPLMILAVGAVGVGLVLGPTGLFAGLLEHHWMETFPRELRPPEGHAHNYLLMLTSSLVALLGIGLAYLLYVKQPATAARVARSAGGAYELSRNRFYIDEIYDVFLVRPITGLAHALRIIDLYVIDGLVDLIGQVPAFIGYLCRPVQNGLVQFYALLMALGVAGFLLAVLLR